MSDERIFLTGGAGLIGSNVAKKLVSLGHEVLLYDSFTAFMSPFQVNYAVNMERRFPPELRNVRIVRGDVRHRGLLTRTLEEFQPTRVIHLAALPIADLSNRSLRASSDTFLKPMLLGRGVESPMLVILIGAIGGAIASGIIGLFIGAVVLALGYELLVAWMAPDEEEPAEA